MRTMNFKGQLLITALLTTMMFLVGSSCVFAHPEVTLKNFADGNIPYAAGLQPAYSAKATCGGCHTYDKIEQHSYHAQIGANQFWGWNQFNPDSPNKFKTGVGSKGKNWVQSPGHLGKW